MFSFLYLSIILIVLFVFRFFVYFDQKKINYWKKKNVPYFPAESFLSKNVLNSMLITHQLINKLYHYSCGKDVCGFFQIRQPVLLIRNPDVVYEILNDGSKYFDGKRSAECTKGSKDPLSQHLLALNGNKWKILRSKLSPTFTSGKLKGMFTLIEECVGMFIDEISKNVKHPIEAKGICGKLSADTIAYCAFGLQLNCLKEENKEFIENAESVFPCGYRQMIRAHFRLLFPKLFKLFRLSAYGNETTTFYCNLVKEIINNRRKNCEVKTDFLYLLMKLQEEDEIRIKEDSEEIIFKFTDEIIASQAFSFFVAGYETTSITMSCVLYEVAQHPEIQDKLKEEIDKITQEFGKMSYDALKKLVYLDQVIDETLRLYPPAFYIPRYCTKSYKLTGTNIVIEENTEVIIPILNIHHDPNNFAEPLVFKPERFNKDRQDRIGKGSFLPFGDGPRKCIGMRFSLLEIKLAMANIISKFYISLHSDTSLTLEFEEFSRIYKTKQPILIQFSRRT